jgi:hypothetical protein
MNQKRAGDGIRTHDEPSNLPGNSHIPDAGAVKGAVVQLPPTPADADLAAVVAAWPGLPADVKKMIGGVVRATVAAKK